MNQLIKNIALTLLVTLTATSAMAADPLPKKESALDLDALLKQLDALTKRLGSLKELFGVLQQVAGDTKSKFFNSVISAQIPNRAEFLDEMAQSMGSSSKLASIEALLFIEYTRTDEIISLPLKVVLIKSYLIPVDPPSL